jgi:hypothetical protein
MPREARQWAKGHKVLDLKYYTVCRWEVPLEFNVKAKLWAKGHKVLDRKYYTVGRWEVPLESNVKLKSWAKGHKVLDRKYYTVGRWGVPLESNVSIHEPDPKSLRANHIVRSLIGTNHIVQLLHCICPVWGDACTW